MKRLSISSKRQLLVYVVVFLWLLFAVITYFNKEVSYGQLSVYFLSLTGFIGVYMWGESMRKSEKTTIFKSGSSSKREILTYMIILIWTLVGILSIVKGLSLIDLASYFGTLTPFVGAYILGETYKPSN